MGTRSRYKFTMNKYKELELGAFYSFGPPEKGYRLFQFIKVTKLGYNFLDVETNCCVLRRHIYRTKASRKLGENFFSIGCVMHELRKVENYEGCHA